MQSLSRLARGKFLGRGGQIPGDRLPIFSPLRTDQVGTMEWSALDRFGSFWAALGRLEGAFLKFLVERMTA
jgi:hypothetical protein